ncbi:MAG: S8 family serine peptidase [Betaproteobacteria bacterium]
MRSLQLIKQAATTQAARAVGALSMYRLAAGALALASLSLVGESAHAGTIDPWLARTLQDGAVHEFFVVMDTSADVNAIARKTRPGVRSERVAAVRDALRSHAERAQAPLRAELDAKGIGHRSFHIVNALLVQGDLKLAEALATRADVLRLEGNPRIRSLPLPEVQQRELALKAIAAVPPGVSDTRATLMWAQGYTGQGIVVGGQDTGVSWSHPALKSQYLGWNGSSVDHNYHWHDAIHAQPPADPNPNPCGYNTTSPCDDNGHGTHTMGTAVGDNGAGEQVGMAPGARWIACRNMDSGAGTPATYLECFEWFLAPYPVGGTTQDGDPARAPHVTINSWGCPVAEGCNVLTLKQAVEAQRAAGIMTVGAAGNRGPGCNTVDDGPGIYDATYSVGAYDPANQTLASFSSRGLVTADGSNRQKPDLVAPGVNVRSSFPGGGYGSISGTSMATPHVAGAVALLWSALPQMQRNIDATESLLNGGATPVALDTPDCGTSGSPNALWGHGKLNVLAAFNNARPSVTIVRRGSGSGAVTSSPSGIDCGATCSEEFTASSIVTLSATPEAGSLFTGWLGGCTGMGACSVVAQPGTRVSATFAPASLAPLRLDIDGNTEYGALSDGLLVLRYLFGIGGAALSNGAIGTGAMVSDPEIQTRLDDLKPLLDIDGNGRADALTDGILVIRYLFGLRGPALISGAIGTGATRINFEAIEAQLASLLN